MATDPLTTGLLGLAAMFLLIILQVPVGIAMGVIGVVGTGLIIGFDPPLHFWQPNRLLQWLRRVGRNCAVPIDG